MRNKQFPNYPDDADYTTNAPSYYEDLARKEKLLRLLAERIWGYEKILDETLEQIQERFRAWDKNLEDFPEDVKVLLQQWLDNGTLDHIINETIFNWKLDTTIFEQFRDSITTQLAQNALDVKNYGAIGDGLTDDLASLNLAVKDAAEKNKILMLPPGVYGISDYWSLPDNLTIFFNNAEIKLLSDSGAIGGVMGNVWNGGVGNTLFTKNVTLINPIVNGNNIAGENLIGFANAENITIYNPILKNATYSGTRAGGRALQFEGGVNGVNNIHVYNPIIENCSIGINAQGYTASPSTNINFYNVSMTDVDVPFNFDSTGSTQGALSHKEMNIYIDGYSLNNCGRITGDYGDPLDGGILTSDRAYGVTLKNGKIVNDSSYGKIGGLIRGKGKNLNIENVEIEADMVAMFNGNVRGFGAVGQTAITAEYTARNIKHIGVVDYVVVAYNIGHMANCLLENIELDTIINGFIDSNGATSLNSFGEFSRREDNTKTPLLSFKTLLESGNNFNYFTPQNRKMDKQVIINKTLASGVGSTIFELDFPAHRRAFIDFKVSTAFGTASGIATGSFIQGISSAVVNGQGSMVTDTTLSSVTTVIVDTLELTAELMKDETNKKILFVVTQTNGSGLNLPIHLNANVQYYYGSDMVYPKIELL